MARKLDSSFFALSNNGWQFGGGAYPGTKRFKTGLTSFLSLRREMFVQKSSKKENRVEPCLAQVWIPVYKKTAGMTMGSIRSILEQSPSLRLAVRVQMW